MKTKQVEEYLPVKLTQEELLDHGQQAAELDAEIQELESEHESVKKSQKAAIAELEESMQKHLRLVRAKEERRAVLCEWSLDTPAKGRKSLIRTDTLDLVRVADMTGDDFQRELAEVAQ